MYTLKVHGQISKIVIIVNSSLQNFKFFTNINYALSQLISIFQNWVAGKYVILITSIILRKNFLMKKNILSGYEKSCGVTVVMEDGSVSVINPSDRIIT